MDKPVAQSRTIRHKPKISITLEQEVYDRIKDTSKKQRRSVSAMINWLCRKAEGMTTSDTNIEEVEE
jgi:predicted CopG family antitoxin